MSSELPGAGADDAALDKGDDSAPAPPVRIDLSPLAGMGANGGVGVPPRPAVFWIDGDRLEWLDQTELMELIQAAAVALLELGVNDFRGGRPDGTGTQVRIWRH